MSNPYQQVFDYTSSVIYNPTFSQFSYRTRTFGVSHLLINTSDTFYLSVNFQYEHNHSTATFCFSNTILFSKLISALSQHILQARDTFIDFISMSPESVHPHDYLYRDFGQIRRVQMSVKLNPPSPTFVRPFLQTLNDSIAQHNMQQAPSAFNAVPLNLSQPSPIVVTATVSSTSTVFPSRLNSADMAPH